MAAVLAAVWQDLAEGTIENCSVSGSVSGTVYVGGVVGAQIGTVPSPDAAPLPQ